MAKISQAEQIADSIWKFMVAEGLTPQLPAVLQFLRKKQLRQQNEATIISRQPLNTIQQQKVIKMLKTHFSVSVIPKFQTSSEITGGLMLKLGDNIIDLTVDNALNNLTLEL